MADANSNPGGPYSAHQHREREIAVPGIVHGYPNLLLRAEALAFFIAAIGAYVLVGGSWTMFLVLMLVPDLFMLGYLFGPRTGAAVYNLGHWYVWPLAFIGVGATLAFPVLLQIGLIWIAHIAFDRVIKAGFKYGEGFRYSHLGVLKAKVLPEQHQASSTAT